jgi:hypothetical protein
MGKIEPPVSRSRVPKSITALQAQRLLGAEPGFPAVYGLAVQEVEAWVLADIDELNRTIFQVFPQPKLPKPPERDPNPKKTLTDLFIKTSRTLDSQSWNAECARLVAPHIRVRQVERKCPKGFGKLVRRLRIASRLLLS